MKNEPIESPAVEAGVVSDRGCVRELNEDRALFVRPPQRELLESKGLLALVADGMGGHQAGEVASGIAVEVVRKVYYESSDEPTAALAEALGEANRAIHQRATADGELVGMGTTCTALAIHRGLAHLAHVGDSRLYLLRGGEMRQMSEDHSHVAELVRQGALTEDQAQNHRHRNVITRALGASAAVDVATWPEPFPVREGDRLLLSTDGLHEHVSCREIRDLALSGSAREACERLVAAAKEAGAPDNVSVVLLTLGSDGDESRAGGTREAGTPS